MRGRPRTAVNEEGGLFFRYGSCGVLADVQATHVTLGLAFRPCHEGLLEHSCRLLCWFTSVGDEGVVRREEVVQLSAGEEARWGSRHDPLQERAARRERLDGIVAMYSDGCVAIHRLENNAWRSMVVVVPLAERYHGVPKTRHEIVAPTYT